MLWHEISIGHGGAATVSINSVEFSMWYKDIIEDDSPKVPLCLLFQERWENFEKTLIYEVCFFGTDGMLLS